MLVRDGRSESGVSANRAETKLAEPGVPEGEDQTTRQQMRREISKGH